MAAEEVTYHERYKDINAKKVRYLHYQEDLPGDTTTLYQIEVYGEQLDGIPVWVLIHVDGANTTFEEIYVAPDGS